MNDRLGEVWTVRGPYPGLGSALCAFGLDRGVFPARHIEAGRRENEDPWPAAEKLFRDPQWMLPKELSGEIPAPLRAAWKQVQQTDRLALLRLPARFEITPDQARVLYEPSERPGAGTDCTDHGILTDPYRSPSLHSPPEKGFANLRCAPTYGFLGALAVALGKQMVYYAPKAPGWPGARRTTRGAARPRSWGWGLTLWRGVPNACWHTCRISRSS